MLKIVVTVFNAIFIFFLMVLLTKDNEKNVKDGSVFMILLIILNLYLIWGEK